MDIQILDVSGDMSLNGSHLLTSINDKSSILDLYVRESIQNSLDAALGKESVRVEYLIGSVEHEKLGREICGLGPEFYSRVGQKAEFLAIKDSGTTGLTGKFLKNEPGEVGNLRKLVFECRESKGNNANSGGSWGLGKTIFFRLNIGIVFYYTRIRKDSGYESRLVGSLIEDQESADSVCPERNGAKSGIVWWGKNYSDNKIIPITDENKINSFLEIFGIPPYKDEETGTTVIVPYVDTNHIIEEEKNRLRESYIQDGDDSEVSGDYRQWLNDFVTYLELSICRWYYPRLNNKYYKYGPSLKVKITDLNDRNNSIDVDLKKTYKVFQLMQSLYNRAAYHNNLPNGYSDFFIENELPNPEVMTISIGEQPQAGHVAYTKITGQSLHNRTGRNSLPYLLFNLSETNNSFVAYTRSLGMIVWFDKIKLLSKLDNEDEYIFSQFVLNTGERLDRVNQDLEAYVRATEGPSHKSWTEETLTIAKRIVKNTENKLRDAFRAVELNNGESGNSLGRALRDRLTPEKRTSQNKTNKHKTRHFTYKLTDVKYSPFTLSYEITMDSLCKTFGVQFLIANDGKSVSFDDFSYSSDFELPIYVNSVNVKKGRFEYKINKDNPSRQIEDLSIQLDRTIKGEIKGITGIRVPQDSPEMDRDKSLKKITLSISIIFDIKDNTIMPEILITNDNFKD